ncbi:hypothetical protein [Streptomyces sp. WAC01280]|uniref:hypothetical protein n=1 Tax=Streptomyces sp. WAC01280 TaxID=2487424 RepID=UPI00163BE5A4|nr:hypothetical protein [Streptomyces sp. WAC01280]
MTDQTVRTPYAHKIRYGVTGAPHLPSVDLPAFGVIPTLVELIYSAARNDRPARVSASVTGYQTRDGEKVRPGSQVAQHYNNGPDGWPEWLAAEARFHAAGIRDAARQAAGCCGTDDPEFCGHTTCPRPDQHRTARQGAGQPAAEGDRIVAHRSRYALNLLICHEHYQGWPGFTPLTSEDLPDGGLCTWGKGRANECGRDVLIPATHTCPDGEPCPSHDQPAEQSTEETPDRLAHVGWWCWRGNDHGHLADTACRSDNVPIHVPTEWADDMRAVIEHLADTHEPGQDCTWVTPEEQAVETRAAADVEEDETR